ncbi:MAG: tyrosine--tRNA ligase [bacterium]|nr:tyrosine--tRNA ligase [bacterium]
MSFFKQTPKVSTDPAKIREFLTRGVERVYPTVEAFEKELLKGKRLTLYYGIDPTGSTLHLGHASNLLKLREFQDLGHEVIILYGGFTAQIGDPTDKLATRQPLTSAQVKKNTSSYKKLIGLILDLGKANIKFLDNEEWSNKLKPSDMMDIASHFTVAQLLERDMFQERIKQGKEIHLHEFLYPVFQAYDAVTMDVDVQLGGNDQTFNMLAGRTLMRKMKNKEKFVVSTKLLVDPTGKKMGKTEGNMVALSDTPTDVFGKVMSWPDGQILLGFELCTRVSASDLDAVKASLERGENPKNPKLRLAEEITALIYGKEKAIQARKDFDATFSEGKPQEFVEIKREGNPMGVLIEKGIVSSKTELRRLISAGAVTSLDSNTKLGEDFASSFPTGKYRIGKHRFIEIK